MKYVLGLGGVFFKAADPEKLAAWYQQHLGLDVEEFGGAVFREDAVADESAPKRRAYAVWSPFAADTDYFARVKNLS